MPITRHPHRSTCRERFFSKNEVDNELRRGWRNQSQSCRDRRRRQRCRQLPPVRSQQQQKTVDESKRGPLTIAGRGMSMAVPKGSRVPIHALTFATGLRAARLLKNLPAGLKSSWHLCVSTSSNEPSDSRLKPTGSTRGSRSQHCCRREAHTQLCLYFW